MMLAIKRIMSVLKVLTNIITITAYPIILAKILASMYVSTFKTDNILYIY
jgi:hypothetical protein